MSDQSGEDEVWIVAQDGSAQPQQITTGGSAQRYAPQWSADSKKIVFGDKNGRVYVVTVATKQMQMVVATGWPAYRGTQASVRTMQHRLYDCNWQMRLPDLGYASEMSVALTSYLYGRGKGGVVQLPGVRR